MRTPRFAICTVSVAVETERSAASAAGLSVTLRGALTPSAAARVSGETRGCAPNDGIGAGGLDDRVGERREPGELDLDDVARLDRPRAGRRAGEDDVAGLERHEAREVGDQQPEREQQVRGGVVLLDLAVDERAHRDGGRVDVAGRDRAARSA